jgi:error-prone DNA polymerase
LLGVTGKLQIANGVTHLVVYSCYNLTALLRSLTETMSDDLPQTLARGDEITKPSADSREAFHKGRSFG